MKAWGIVSLLAGIVAIAVACFMTTTAPTSDVYNLGLLQMQAMTFNGGCSLAIIGVVLFAADAVRIVVPITMDEAAPTKPPSARPPDSTPMAPRLSPEEYDRKRGRDDRIVLTIGAIIVVVFIVVAVFAPR